MGFTETFCISCRQTVRAASAAGPSVHYMPCRSARFQTLWGLSPEGNPRPITSAMLSFQTVLGRPSANIPSGPLPEESFAPPVTNNRSLTSHRSPAYICTADDICYRVFFHTYVMFHPGSPFRRPHNGVCFTLKAWTVHMKNRYHLTAMTMEPTINAIGVVAGSEGATIWPRALPASRW